MAGYWGGLLDPADIDSDAALTLSTDDCGAGGGAWAYELDLPVTSLNNATAAAANAAHDCIDASEFQDGTDVLAVKRVTADRVPGDTTACVAGYFTADELARERDGRHVYLADNGGSGLLYEAPSDPGALDAKDAEIDATVGGCTEHRKYKATIYYIRDHSIDADDGIPTLCRAYLSYSADNSASPAITEECLVEGIEQIQFEYGVDETGNGTPNRYVSAPSAAQLADTVALRIHVVARSLQADTNYDNPKTYLAGDVSYTPADNFYRRSGTTTVILRNPANLRNMGN
jgi:type IV pilus assembly protein PilW